MSKLFRAVLVIALWAFAVMPAFAQNSNQTGTLTASGTVLDSSSAPLAGAYVVIKGSTQQGTVTDLDGKFSLKFKEEAGKTPILVFSFIGMETKEIPFSAFKNGSKVILKEDANVLDDVVVTGYATIREESFTGASTKFSADEIAKAAPTNLLKGLAVLEPSFKMAVDNINGSNPNTMADFYVRGRSGISEITELDQATGNVSEFALKNNPSAPIFILDGFEVEQSTIYDLDVNRISSITLLKDAAATAVYGSRAANGVIVIETSTPDPGKVRVAYNNTLSLSTPDITSYNMMNARQALEAEWDAGLFESTSPDKNAGAIVNYYDLMNNVIRGVDTDWIAKPLRTSFSHKHYLDLGGGNDEIRWNADLTYQDKEGVMKSSSRNNWGTSMSVDYRHKGLQIKNKMTFNTTSSVESPYGSFSDYVRMKPYLDPIDPETNEYYKQFLIYRAIRRSVSEPVYVVNPLYEATLYSFDKSTYKEFIDNLGLNWNITPYLMAKASLSASFRFTESDKFIDPRSGKYVTADIMDKGSYTDGEIKSLNWNANAMIAYNRTINRNHINFTLGGEAAQNKSNSEYAKYKGFVEGAKASPKNAIAIIDEPVLSDSQTRRAGAYLQGNYTYKDIYLADIAGRYEGSSTFGAKRKMGTFWSTGLGMNIHNYSAIKDLGWINRLKIRATYGLTGKANFSPYQARTTYNLIYDNPYKDVWGIQLKGLGNEELKWEKVNKFNVGLETALFDNILSMRLDWYNELTVDQVQAISIPSSSGFTTYMGNVGKVSNKGIDLRLNVKVYSSKDADLYVFTNLNRNTNKIVEIGEALKSYNAKIDEYFKSSSATSTDTKYSTPFTKYEVGNSLTAIYGMKSLGIDPATGKELYEKRDGTVTYDWSSAEQQCLGDRDPKLSGTFGFNGRLGHWTLYTTFAFRCGGQAYNTTLQGIENVNLENYSGDVRIFTDRWKQPGDIASLKSIKDRSYITRPTSRFVQDDNTMTMSAVSLGYDFDRKLVQKAKLSSLRLQMNMEDLFTVSSIKLERGTAYPYARTFNLSLNATF